MAKRIILTLFVVLQCTVSAAQSPSLADSYNQAAQNTILTTLIQACRTLGVGSNEPFVTVGSDNHSNYIEFEKHICRVDQYTSVPSLAEVQRHATCLKRDPADGDNQYSLAQRFVFAQTAADFEKVMAAFRNLGARGPILEKQIWVDYKYNVYRFNNMLCRAYLFGDGLPDPRSVECVSQRN